MNLSTLWNLAVAEMRSCRRLVRTWVIIVIVALIAFGTWLTSSSIFAFSSFLGSEVFGGLNSPRFMASVIGGQIVSLFSLGILFLAFDIRIRDDRSRITEVLDNRPMSNVELLTGRLCGIVLLMGAAAIITVLIVAGIALVLYVSGVPIGHRIDPVSLLVFLLWDIVPNLAFMGSLTIFLTILVRLRVVVVIIGLVMLAVSSFGSINLPVIFQPAIASYVFVNITPSELAPQIVTSDVLLNRTFLMLLTAGFLALAASIHPRNSPTKVRQINGLSGLVLVVSGALTITGMIYSILSGEEKANNWAAAHAGSHGSHPTDIKSISGSVEIFPGHRIDLDLVLNLEPTQDGDTDTWMFSLNPGYQIEEIAIDGTSTPDYSFENGLLRISKKELKGSNVQLAILARGVPHPRFAYLDGSLDWRDLNVTQTQQLSRLGTSSYTFHPHYVALVPGVTWLPISGTMYRRDLYEESETDFFKLDVEVTVPKNWIVVGPGERIPISDDRRARFRFNPQVPIPEVALFASKFERRAVEIQGIDFEIFVDKKHTAILEIFEDAAPALESWIDERLFDLKESGLEYRFGTYSMVEIPSSLRTYGGGWRMNSILGSPSILMVRENGFPIARFDNAFGFINPQETPEEEVANGLLEIAKRFFDNNTQGASPVHHFSRNLVSYQTRPEGHGSTSIDFVVNELANDLWTLDNSYFSVYTYTDFAQSLRVQFADELASDPRITSADRHSVWQRTLNTSLANLDFYEDSFRAMQVLHLRGLAFVSVVSNSYEKESIGAFLNLLVDRYLGKTYSQDQFLQTALDAGLDFEHIGGSWLETHQLPGYFATNAKLERIADSDSRGPVYQTTFVIRNNEPVPGTVTISHTRTREQASHTLHMETIWVPPNTSLRVASQFAERPDEISVRPNISLNRSVIRLPLESEGTLETTNTPELPLIEEVDWVWPFEDEIVVDDLDPGFSIVQDGSEETQNEVPWLVRYFFGQVINLDLEPELDEGLPEDSLWGSVEGGGWTRNSSSRIKSFGKYRQTFARESLGGTKSHAKFSATLPSTGLWELRFHIPQTTIDISAMRVGISVGDSSVEFESDAETTPQDPDGVLMIQVQYGDNTESIELELAGKSMTWQSLGIFDLDTTDVDVLVLGAAKGRAFADAIHWVRVEEE